MDNVIQFPTPMVQCELTGNWYRPQPKKTVIEYWVVTEQDEIVTMADTFEDAWQFIETYDNHDLRIKEIFGDY